MHLNKKQKIVVYCSIAFILISFIFPPASYSDKEISGVRFYGYKIVTQFLKPRLKDQRQLRKEKTETRDNIKTKLSEIIYKLTSQTIDDELISTPLISFTLTPSECFEHIIRMIDQEIDQTISAYGELGRRKGLFQETDGEWVDSIKTPLLKQKELVIKTQILLEENPTLYMELQDQIDIANDFIFKQRFPYTLSFGFLFLQLFGIIVISFGLIATLHKL